MTEHDRIDATEQLLLQVARSIPFWVSGDGRIGEKDAARLLAWSPDSLRNARNEGNGPPWFRIGGGGHKVTYRIRDLAIWIECKRIQPDVAESPFTLR